MINLTELVVLAAKSGVTLSLSFTPYGGIKLVAQRGIFRVDTVVSDHTLAEASRMDPAHMTRYILERLIRNLNDVTEQSVLAGDERVLLHQN